MANFCHKCGTRLAPGAGFCPNCGQKILSAGKLPGQKDVPGQENAARQPRQKKAAPQPRKASLPMELRLAGR